MHQMSRTPLPSPTGKTTIVIRHEALNPTRSGHRRHEVLDTYNRADITACQHRALPYPTRIPSS